MVVAEIGGIEVKFQVRFSSNHGNLRLWTPDHTLERQILCVESDSVVLESSAVLKHSGYYPASASPQVAEILLRSQKFDLLVVSRLRDSDLHRVINLSDGAEVLVLDDLTMPSEMLSLVTQRLNRHQRRA